jgi:glycosyltransferase involved in cell wall biosynthesis
MVEKNELTFAVFFPGCLDIHLTKDVGMIPYIMHRNLGYNSYLICYKNGNYPQLDACVPGLKILFLDHNLPFLGRLAEFLGNKSSLSKSIVLLCTLFDAFMFLIKWGRKIDVLQLYHLKTESILVGFIFRIINRRGTLYLKLDLDIGAVAAFRDRPSRLRNLLYTYFSLRYLIFNLAFFDIISVETKAVYTIAKDFHPFFKNCRDRVHYITNGIDMQSVYPLLKPFNSKENKILHIGRLGNIQKGSELAVEAFSNIYEEFSGWELELIGSMEGTFSEFLEKFKSKNDSIAGRMSYLGILDRAQLHEHYSKAKILIAPSRWESFGLVVVEAGAFGNAILGSDIPSYRELTNDGKVGYLCPVNSLECLTERLRYMLSHKVDLEIKSNQISEFIRDNFNWEAICGTLNGLILLSLRKRGGKR